jgi:hypothetical protein
LIVAGIDEAGLGPVLGPLVVTASAFEVAPSRAEEDFWRLWSPAVSRRPSRKRQSVAIGDSKKLYHRRSRAGLEHIERAVLGMLAASDRHPASLRDLLEILSPGSTERLADYPWYAQADLSLPRCITPTNAGFSGNALAEAMDRSRAKLHAIRCEPLLVREYNQHAQATRNKSTVLFDLTCRLLSFLWGRTRDVLRVFVDRQGGRQHYLPALQRVFSDGSFRVLEECETASRYSMEQGGKRMELHFLVGAEDRHLPVALASMTCKYLRELLMEVFNAFWLPHVPDLAPTAGYYTDGRRFYGEIQAAMQRLEIAPDLVYRCR